MNSDTKIIMQNQVIIMDTLHFMLERMSKTSDLSISMDDVEHKLGMFGDKLQKRTEETVRWLEM